jgi:hypothetical protein
MNRSRIQLLAATALVGATSFAGGTAAWASPAARPQIQVHVVARPANVGAIDSGEGATAKAAQRNATQQLLQDFYGCGPVSLVSDAQQPDGTWLAEVSAVCQGSE